MTSDGKPGASLRVWRDYFINSEVYGADIDKNILFEEDRIKTFYVDQLDQDSIKKLWRNIKKNEFDLILDDGLHSFEAGIVMFLNSFDRLRKNGIYIIEDVHTTYIDKLANALSEYNPEIIILKDKRAIKMDNNLIVIRKS
jgi:23S rRNA U2552 (ribose-2'-O)-methylase RlmE/FtsJ